MRSESLLSQLSNMSHVSNSSYGASKQEYSGPEFFIQSLPYGLYKNVHSNQVKLEQVWLEGSEFGYKPTFTSPKDHPVSYNPYWTNSLCENIQGTSDNENEPETAKKQLHQAKQEPKQSENQFLSVAEEKQSVPYKSTRKSPKNNESKNIPKNYGKAIIIFFERGRKYISKVLEDENIDYDELLQKLMRMKPKINTISDLKNLWSSHLESRALRIISNYFLRKHSLHYIYNSRIKSRQCHAKYKRRLLEAITNPEQFNHIKDY